eukprot:GHVH01008683.1.p1 GENE.GHVH01008683.1~~GHVH01008683.1.p1  ORF type:complete len:207 (+),score=16.01 GHVH01008683.1:49-621(+)
MSYILNLLLLCTLPSALDIDVGFSEITMTGVEASNEAEIQPQLLSGSSSNIDEEPDKYDDSNIDDGVIKGVEEEEYRHHIGWEDYAYLRPARYQEIDDRYLPIYPQRRYGGSYLGSQPQYNRPGYQYEVNQYLYPTGLTTPIYGNGIPQQQQQPRPPQSQPQSQSRRRRSVGRAAEIVDIIDTVFGVTGL